MNHKAELVNELHKAARRNYERRHVDMRGLDETWQADLVDMSAYSAQNKGYKFLLTIIDNFSKFAWAVPTKTKNGHDITQAMSSILKQKRKPRNLHVDQGKEFYNKDFKELMREYDINMYSTFSGMKASICERFNRTLKNQMWKRFSMRGSFKWIDILPDLLLTYNNTKHRTIKMKPNECTLLNEKHLLHDVYRQKVNKIEKAKFKVNDRVRVSKYKHTFEKGYTPNWTTEIFTVSRVMKTIPITYKLTDYQNHPIKGGFYTEELLKVKHPDVYLVEKVLRTHGNKMYVKWLGFDSSHNSWINKTDI